MRSFTVPDRSPEEFAASARVAAREHGLAGLVSVEVRDDVMEVELSRLGTSRLLYHLAREEGGGFSAHLEDARIAMTHAPMRALLESRFGDVIRHLGGEVS